MTAYHEAASQGALAERYYSGGAIRRIPAPSIHPTSTLAQFRMVESQRVREARDGTTEAVEMTLAIEGDGADAIAAQMQPGLYFALEPKNHKDAVDVILAAVKPSPQEAADGRITVPVHSAYMMTNDAQNLSKREVLTGLVDVSRPTEQLVNLLALRAEAAGNPLPHGYDAAEIAACYSVAELLQYRPGVMTVEDIYANQPSMKARPYTISDFDRDNRRVKILVSGVSADLPPGDPLGIKQHGDARIKDGGTSSGMLLDIASAGKDGAPDADFPINGYLLTRFPGLLFPGQVRETEAVTQLKDSNPHVGRMLEAFAGGTADTTLYFLATGSGMAPYMSLLRELERQQAADPEHKNPFPGNIVLINGGRHAEDELYAEECRSFVEKGLVQAYHAASSASGTEKYVTLKDGQLHEQEVQGRVAGGGRYYIQDVLQAAYGQHMEGDIRAGKAKLYVCGTQGALRGTFQKWPDAFRESKFSLQHTASIPGRYFEHGWKRMNEVTSHREPMPVQNRGENPGAWTRRALKIVEVREGEAARSHAR